MAIPTKKESGHLGWLADFQENLALWRKIVGVAGSAMCHDLNNPLQGVVGFADLLLQTTQDKSLKSDLQVIMDGGMACRNLADDFGDLADEFGPEPSDVFIEEVVRAVLFSVLPEERWRIEIPDDLKTVRTDPLYLALLLRGLSSMATDQVAEGFLQVSAGSEGEVVFLCALNRPRPEQEPKKGPSDLDYWLGRRAARLLGGGMDRSIEEDRVMTRAHIPGLLP